MLTDAIIRNMEIIGEASKHLSSDMRKKYKDIPWQMMVSMRNKMTHEYFGVDIKILWKTIKDDLPPLKKQLSLMLSDIK